jgi:hypothetical protein
LRQCFSDVFQPPFYLAGLAAYEAIDTVMLIFEGSEESVAKGSLGGGALTRYRGGFAGARGRLVLYEIFEVIVVDVDWNAG